MRVLVVEDENRLAMLIRLGLSEEGHAVDIVADGESGLSWIAAANYDALVLDVMLPGMSGIETCRVLRSRRNTIPILLLTARDSVLDRVQGLDAGADDYLTKPFALMELSARLRALARRPPVAHEPVIGLGDLEINVARREVSRDGTPILLTNKEFRILEYLARNSKRVLTRDMIANHVWDYEFANATNVIDVHIRQIRRKVDRPDGVSLIETVRGVGYRVLQAE